MRRLHLSLEQETYPYFRGGSAAVTIEASTRYVLRAENGDGVRTEALEVIVDDRPEIHSFKVNLILLGRVSLLLSWDVACRVVKIDNGAPAISGEQGSTGCAHNW